MKRKKLKVIFKTDDVSLFPQLLFWEHFRNTKLSSFVIIRLQSVSRFLEINFYAFATLASLIISPVRSLRGGSGCDDGATNSIKRDLMFDEIRRN